MGQIFDSHVHHLKLFKIKNPFRIVQTNPQIPEEWVAPFYFLRDMFCWDRDTLIVTLTTLFSRHLFLASLVLFIMWFGLNILATLHAWSRRNLLLVVPSI